MEKYFRNPNRKAHSKKIEKYVPENIRLGVNIPPPAEVSPSDFKYAFDKSKADMANKLRREAAGPIKQPEPKRVRIYKESEQPYVNIDQQPTRQVSGRFPKQLKVNSGFGHEHTWHPDPLEENEQSFQELENEERVISSRKFNYNDIPFPQEEEKLSVEDINSSTLSNLEINRYFISIENEIIFSSPSLLEIEEMLDYILFDADSPLGDVSVEDISVFKKLEVKTGIVVKT